MQISLPKKTPIFLIQLLLSLSIMIYLITYIDFERVRFIVPRLRMQYVWCAFCLLLATNLAVSMRWSMLLKHFKIRQKVIDSWRYYMIGAYYSILLPGVISGDAVRLGLSLKAHRNHKALLTASILFERYCGFLIIVTMASAASALVPILLEGEQSIAKLIIWFTLAVLASFLLFFVLVKNGPKRWFQKTVALSSWKQTIIDLIGHFRTATLRLLASLLLLSALAHFLDILGSFFLSKALHIDQPFSVFLLIMPLVYVVTILPISIGGIGVREGVLTFFMIKVGVLASDAVLLAFVIYLNRLCVALIGGFMHFVKRTKGFDQK